MSLAIRALFGRPSRRVPWIITALLLLLGTGTAAYAFWASTTSSNNAAAAADALSAGSKPAVTANGASLSVSWAAGTTVNGRAATGYTVTRYAAATGGTGTPATGGCAGTVTTLTCTEQNVPGGIWYYTVTPTIALWTGSESPRSTGVSSDSTAPVASVSGISPTPNAAGWNSTSPVTVTITADDGTAGSGVASITYAVDGGAKQTVGGSVTSIPVSGDGTHTVSYFATDNAGNAGTAQSQTVRIDTQAPAAPGLSVPGFVNSANVAAVPVTGTAEAGAKITLTAGDTGSAHSAPPATATADATGNWTASLDLTSLNQGTVTYSAVATDVAGNTSTARTAASIKDTIAPAPAQGVGVPVYVNSTTVSSVRVFGSAETGTTVTVAATDTTTAPPVTGTATDPGTGWSLNLNLTPLKDGTVTYTVTVKDAAGNSSSAVTPSPTSLKDTLAPKLTIDTPAYIYSGNVGSYKVSGTNDPGLTVSLSVSDSTTSVPATASGTPWTTSGLNLAGLKETSTVIPVVTVTITATTSDAAGNSSTVTATAVKDTQWPTVTSVKLLNGGSTNTRQASADAGDTITLKFSEKLDLAKVCTNWTGSQLSGTATITDNAGNDTLGVTIPGCSVGTVSLGGDYLNGAAATFGAQGTGSTLNWDAANNALVIKLGNAPNGSSGAGTLNAGVPAGLPAYAPPQSLTDVAGNLIGTVSFRDTLSSGLG